MNRVEDWVISLTKEQQQRLFKGIKVGGKAFKNTLFQLLEETDIPDKNKKRIA